MPNVNDLGIIVSPWYFIAGVLSGCFLNTTRGSQLQFLLRRLICTKDITISYSFALILHNQGDENGLVYTA